MYNYQNEPLYRVSSKDCQPHDKALVMAEMETATCMVVIYKTANGEIKTMFTDLSSEEFLTLCIAINRHEALYKIFKLVMKDIDTYKQAPNHDDNFTFKAVEYIRMNKHYQTKKINQNESI